MAEHFEHRFLDCGIELAILPMASRPVVAMEIRFFAGYAFEHLSYLGLAHVVEEVISKGTDKRDGQALNDAFDEIGATHSVCTGRETFGFSSLFLPEYIEPAIALHAEMIRTPSFPDEACKVAVDLSQQALAALKDDPNELAKKLLHKQSYGDPLGRHALGEMETLSLIGREQVVNHWKQHFSNSRMQVSIAGAVESDRVADLLEEKFEGFHSAEEEGNIATERPSFHLDFSPARLHYSKDLEQEQIAICFPGAAVDDDDFAVQRVIVGVLSGGMSGRLFTEVREKQGLVYWVGAWRDQPRRAGMIHLGASTTPQNVDKTYTTLLREIDRLAEDVTKEEIDRAVAGIVTRVQTRGDVTRAKAAELVNDLFYHGRPVSSEEKIAKVKAVGVEDIRRFLELHPRDKLGVVTLGPKELSGE